MERRESSPLTNGALVTMTSLPTPSQLGRVAACITSEALPHVQSTSPAARFGQVVHAFLAACLAVGRDDALLTAPQEHRAALEVIDLTQLPAFDPGAYAPEVAFALHLATGQARELGRMLTREEAHVLGRPGEMVGIADVVGMTSDAVVVWDYKSGHGHVDRAAVNWQIKTYLLMGARAYGRSHACGGIIKLRDNGDVWFDRIEMDELDLDAHEAALRRLLAEREHVLWLPAEQRPSLVEGRHCRYCPALPQCPAKVALLRATFDAQLDGEVIQLSADRAARAWKKLESAEQLIERLKSVLKDYARSHPFPTEDGYIVGERIITTERIVPASTKTALTPLYGEQLAAAIYSDSAETTTTISKKAFESALRKHVLPTLPRKRGVITEMLESAEDALRKGRAFSTSTHGQVEEFRPRVREAIVGPELEGKA